MPDDRSEPLHGTIALLLLKALSFEPPYDRAHRSSGSLGSTGSWGGNEAAP